MPTVHFGVNKKQEKIGETMPKYKVATIQGYDEQTHHQNQILKQIIPTSQIILNIWTPLKEQIIYYGNVQKTSKGSIFQLHLYKRKTRVGSSQ